MASFRQRFPPSLSIDETDHWIIIPDRREVELLIIYVSPHEKPNRHHGIGFSQINRRHARTLARAILRMVRRP